MPWIRRRVYSEKKSTSILKVQKLRKLKWKRLQETPSKKAYMDIESEKYGKKHGLKNFLQVAGNVDQLMLVVSNVPTVQR